MSFHRDWRGWRSDEKGVARVVQAAAPYIFNA